MKDAPCSYVWWLGFDQEIEDLPTLILILRAHSRVIITSEWPEVICMNTNTTTAATIRELRKTFARFGLLEEMVFDSGPQFVSAEFTWI